MKSLFTKENDKLKFKSTLIISSFIFYLNRKVRKIESKQIDRTLKYSNYKLK